jgi:transposase-like protein
LISKDTDTSNFWGKDGLLKQLTKRLVEKALEGEMDEHLGYNRYARDVSNDNSRNGLSSKDVITENGVVTIDVPRDRESSFEPILVPKSAIE